MSLETLTRFSLLCIVSISFTGCVKKPLISIPTDYNNTANEGIIYYLPKNIYQLDVDARLTQCGKYTDTKIIDSPMIDITTKIKVRTVADENASYTARPQTFGDWNDDLTTHFTRSSSGMLLSVTTTNDDKSAEVVSDYIAAAASVALAVQTSGLSLTIPPTIKSISEEVPSIVPVEKMEEEKSICKEEYLLALTNYEKNKKGFKEKAEKIAQLSEKIADLEKSIANTERAKEKGLKQLLDKRDENDKKLIQLNKEIADINNKMSKLDKQLTFSTSMTLFDSSKKQEKYQHTLGLSKLFNQVFKKEFMNKDFDGQTAAKILEDSNFIEAKMTDSNGNVLTPNYINYTELSSQNKEEKGLKGIVYRDRKNAYLEISKIDELNKKNILFRDWVPFIQGGKIGIAPIYNWSGKGSSSVKFDDNGSLIEYKSEIIESSGEKSSNAAKAIGSTVQDYSEKNMELEKTQLQHEIEMLQLKQQIKELKEKLNGTL